HDYVRAAGFFILVELIGKPSRRGALLAGVGEAAEPVKLHFLDKLAKLLKLLLGLARETRYKRCPYDYAGYFFPQLGYQSPYLSLGGEAVHSFEYLVAA